MLAATVIGRSFSPGFVSMTGPYKNAACHQALVVVAAIMVCLIWPELDRTPARGQQPREPAGALAKLYVADGLTLRLFAAEPMVRQPVTMTVDERGRVWVIQYLQYPEPAGLKRVSGDRYDRIRYDRRPDPPPFGPVGADRVTILEDTDRDGRADRADDFVNGLNLASGLALGPDGVWILQSPYLLFYPDRDRDDRPDGDPEVRLTGFGLDDAHSVANSLQWGPDGWLYGAHGSTVNADVRGIQFQQGIWRYHPRQDRFELFSEGGGNTYGLDFDSTGNAIAGTNWGIPGLHQMQGAYHVKIFGKHGALHNPYAFGYFPHMPHHGAPIGKLSVGGVFYHAARWPKRFHGKYLAANPLNHALYSIEVRPHGSTFSTHFHERLMWSEDPWFQPVDLALDVDGSLLVADWYDGNINYQRTYRDRANFDVQRGRIYRISAASSSRTIAVPPDSGGASLVEKLRDSNIVRVRQTLESLSARADPRLGDAFKQQFIATADDREALHALWALNQCGRFADDRELWAAGLSHRAASVRSWTVRLLGDRGHVDSRLRDQLVTLARRDSDMLVLAQLACTARRLPGPDCLAIASELMRRDAGAADPYLPLLLWWAVESKAVEYAPQIQGWLSVRECWEHPLVRKTLVPRLARRYAALGGDLGFGYCTRLLSQAPTAGDVERVIESMEQQLEGLRQDRWPAELKDQISRLWQASDHALPLVLFSLRMGNPDALAESLRRMSHSDVPLADRQTLIRAVAHLGKREALDSLIALLQNPEPDSIRSAALSALASFSGELPGRVIMDRYKGLDPALREQARQLLYRRPSWSLTLLHSIDRGELSAVQIPYQELSLLLQHNSVPIRSLVEKHWGKFRLQTPEAKRRRMLEVGKLVKANAGDASHGKQHFSNTCAKCHRLHGEGEVVGPDLTPYPRHQLAYLLLHTIDPNAVIRPAYQAVVIATTDGRILTGRIAEQSEKTITLLDAKNNRTLLAREAIERLQDGPQSLMPEKQLGEMSAAQIRDLFAYLQSKASEPLDHDLSTLECLRSGFDRPTSEWTLTDNGTLTAPRYLAKGGNPTGWLQLNDASGGRMAVVLPDSWCGDLTSFRDGTLSFDARTVDSKSGSPHPTFGLIEITGAGQTVRADAAGPGAKVPGTSWTGYQIVLSHERFQLDPNRWSDILRDVQRIVIRMEGFGNANEVMGLDNVSLKPAVGHQGNR